MAAPRGGHSTAVRRWGTRLKGRRAVLCYMKTLMKRILPSIKQASEGTLKGVSFCAFEYISTVVNVGQLGLLYRDFETGSASTQERRGLSTIHTSQYHTRPSASLRALSPCAYLVSELAGELVSLRITEQENWCITNSSALDPAPELMYLVDDGQDNSRCVHVWQHMQLSGLWSCAGAASCNRNQAHQTALSTGITVQ